MILSNDNKYRGNIGSSLKLDEYSHVEKPFVEQLKDLGWNTGKNQVLELEMQQTPEQSYRTSFSEVVLQPKLRQALISINPFLTDGQIDEVVKNIILSRVEEISPLQYKINSPYAHDIIEPLKPTY